MPTVQTKQSKLQVIRFNSNADVFGFSSLVIDGDGLGDALYAPSTNVRAYSDGFSNGFS